MLALRSIVISTFVGLGMSCYVCTHDMEIGILKNTAPRFMLSCGEGFDTFVFQNIMKARKDLRSLMCMVKVQCSQGELKALREKENWRNVAFDRESVMEEVQAALVDLIQNPPQSKSSGVLLKIDEGHEDNPGVMSYFDDEKEIVWKAVLVNIPQDWDADSYIQKISQTVSQIAPSGPASLIAKLYRGFNGDNRRDQERVYRLISAVQLLGLLA